MDTDRELLTMPGPAARDVGVPPVPLGTLDGDLDRQFARACALVAQAAPYGARADLVTTAGRHPVPQFWAACDARAAQLCNRYGVEILLVEEAGEVRIRIEHHTAPGQDATPGTPAPVRPRRPWPGRWWAARIARQRE